MNETLLVNPKILALLGEEDGKEISALDGCIYDKDDRHYLHIIVGKLGDHLIKYVTKYQLKNKDIQALISDQEVQPLIRAGILVRATSPGRVFDIKLVVDDYGNLVRTELTNNLGKTVIEGRGANKEMKLQDFIYRCIGQYYGR